MASILSSVTSVVTAAIGWMGSVVTSINASGNELLLLFTVLPLVGLGIGFFKRIIN